MTEGQWDEIISVIEEHIWVEQHFNMTPRFQQLKQLLQSKPYAELDWYIVDDRISVLHREYIMEYVKIDLKNRENR